MPAVSTPAAKPHVVAIGASAGGLEACRRLARCVARLDRLCLRAVHHLDPSHRNLLVELTSPHRVAWVGS